MGITVKWDTADETIIRFDFVGRCTWDDFYVAAKQAQVLLRSVTHNVDFIYDALKGDLRLIMANPSYAEKLLADKLPNCGMTAIVGADYFTKALYELFRRIFPKTVRQYPVIFCPSLDAARLSLAQRRSGNGSG